MATRELYERHYGPDIRAELRVYREKFRATLFRPGRPPEPHELTTDWPKYSSAQSQTDGLAAAEPTSDWRRILECPVCETREVVIQRLDNRDAYDIDCPQCTTFRLSGMAFMIFADVQEGLGGDLKARLADMQLYLQTPRPDDRKETITSENWLWFVEEGRKLKRDRS